MLMHGAVLEECNLKNHIKSHGFKSKKLMNTGKITITFLVHISALVSLYQINTHKCSGVLLNHRYINTIYNCYIYQPLQGHLQGV